MPSTEDITISPLFKQEAEVREKRESTVNPKKFEGTSDHSAESGVLALVEERMQRIMSKIQAKKQLKTEPSA